ncbi:Arl8a protein [Phellopilus nigrolimitatus]|nr:Arl8a protein [Phellopilus nigrolimitatus]
MAFLLNVFHWLVGLFFSKKVEICIVGLQASGKTSLVNVLGSGQWTEDVIPTVAFNLRKVRKGNVTMMIWDVAGQPKFRSMWDRYCKGNDAIVFVVDSTDKERFDSARFELHSLLSSPQLAEVPLLVLGNKCDLLHLEPASVEELIFALQLDKIQSRPVSCYSCSMKEQHNLDIIVRWLSERGH